MNRTALIAEDEPLLAAGLQATLNRIWPGLSIRATVTNGVDAVQETLKVEPDVIFLDIRMPGMSGLDVAEAVAEEWASERALPLVVFVTAYDQYAIQAFEHAAVDYLLKPVDLPRLQATCTRLQAALEARDRAPLPATIPAELARALGELRTQLEHGGAAAPARLAVLQASIGATIHLVPLTAVLYFEAADKYVRVVTAERELVIRMPLRQLVPQLDPQLFWQIHRSIVVRADVIATAVRDDSGRLELTLRGHGARLPVSRLYAHLFRAM